MLNLDNHFTSEVFEQIWEDRYKKNNETYTDNLRRVAKKCSTTQQEEDTFFYIMNRGLFFPGGRTMSNAGIGKQLTMNNCFTAPQVQDSLEDIFDKVALGARTHQRGGGIGYDFSKLRPNGFATSNDAVASGPVSFMDVFNAQTATILQGNRRGANMGVLNIYHPDIEMFIDAKAQDSKRLCHFNLSVMIDDAFMNAVQCNGTVCLHWPVYDDVGNIINNQSEWKYSKEIDARSLWDKIIKRAYDTGEPGVMFYDSMNNVNPLYYTEKIVCSNPCFEYLSGTVFGQDKDSTQYGGACNLGSLMLHKFVTNPFTDSASIDFELLDSTIRTAVKMLDNIITINTFPDPIYDNYQKAFRTIGLGVTGLADMLCMLNKQYDKEASRVLVDNLMNHIAQIAYDESANLASVLGAFNAYSPEYLSNNFLAWHTSGMWGNIKAKINKHGIRNAKILAIAPAGTMSLVFGNNCSSGIEPIFCLEYDRTVKIGAQSDAAARTISVQDYAYYRYKQRYGDKSSDVFVTAQDISVDAHIEMMGVIAKHVDMSVSKTINIPEEYSFEDTKDVYMKVWQLGIKGCTIFRPNELRQGIFSTSAKLTTEKKNSYQLQRGDIIDTSDSVVGKKRKLKSGCGSLHVAAFFDPCDASLMEVYLSKGSTGGCQNYMIGLSRMISLSARAGVDVHTIVDQLNSTGVCPSYAIRKATKGDTSVGSCCAMAVGNALLDMWEEMKNDTFADIDEVEFETELHPIDNKNVCPECGEPLLFEGGCCICKSCGYSRCS